MSNEGIKINYIGFLKTKPYSEDTTYYIECFTAIY